MYTLINNNEEPQGLRNFKAQNLSEHDTKGVIQDARDFLWRIAQPPKGRPTNKFESFMPLTATY